MYDYYQNVIYLYSSFLNRESELDKKKSKYSNIISSFLEIAFFSFELITQKIGERLTIYNVPEGFQILLFVIIGIIIIPVLSKYITSIIFQGLFISSKYQLFKRNADKDMYICFYQYIFPICSNINQIIKNKQTYNILTQEEVNYLKRIVIEMKNCLERYKHVSDMYVYEGCSDSFKEERIYLDDYNFCSNTLDTFKKIF